MQRGTQASAYDYCCFTAVVQIPRRIPEDVYRGINAISTLNIIHSPLLCLQMQRWSKLAIQIPCCTSADQETPACFLVDNTSTDCSLLLICVVEFYFGTAGLLACRRTLYCCRRCGWMGTLNSSSEQAKQQA